MPIYENDEHEYLSSKAKKMENNAYINGMLYLSDKRIIFEKKGQRAMVRASPTIIDLNIFLYNVENASYAVPAFPLFTKQMLSIEYYDENRKLLRADFAIKKSKNWVEQIKREASIAKKDEYNNRQKNELERKQHELDLAKAKAPNANIGMAIFGNDKKKDPRSIIQENMADEDTNLPQEMKCPHCGYSIDSSMVYCPHCGYKLK
ncbi:MAG: zinc ribbon domain-containing protein [Ferroplasma sp.]